MAFEQNLDARQRDGRAEGASLITRNDLGNKISARLIITQADIDTGRVQLFGLDRSFDGGLTWEHWVSATPTGLTRAGDGPTISATHPGDAFLIRPFVVTSDRIRVGCEIERDV